jgi:hypothetical protein
MIVILLVALFCVALSVMLIGSYLSSRSRTHTYRDDPYAPRTERSGGQRNRANDVYPKSAVDQPYRQLKQSYARAERAGVTRRQSSSLQAYPRRLYSSNRRTGVKGAVGLWSARTLHWLKLPLITGTLFCLCLLLFVQMMNPRLFPATIATVTNLAPHLQPNSQDTTLDVNNLSVSNASKSVVRLAQADPKQYSSQNEHDQWADSACSAAAMTEIINAYGHSYRITDILKVEAGLHEITPDLGLLEAKGIDRTMGQFGFKMVPLQPATLDNAIAVADQGHPIIVSFTNSGYWPGGHILVLRGGDTQNVDLADSSRLNETVVSRNQFLQWWNGFTALAIPQ